MRSRLQIAAYSTFEPVVDAVAPAAPSFLVVAARVRSEQHAAGFQAGMQSEEDIGQRPARYVEQRRVGEHAVEAARRQIERKEILLPHLAPAVGARHRGELRRPFETD